ncbi:MAG: phosphate signaling complex protein PhoU [Elusimicrobiota bacterium]|nr:phosphate signaling complex protein PhoU [Elusimicrobiota bacterium]
MRHFDMEINDLKNSLVDMAGLVREMIQSIRDQLVSKNVNFYDKLYALEKEVNIQEIVIDDKCLKLIALNQPVGTDLRFITSAMKINTDLERMADETISIGKRIYVNQDILEDISKMAEIVQQMVEDAIKAFNTSDVELARAILVKDKNVDNLKDKVFNHLKHIMINSTDENEIQKNIDQITMLRNMQRIGDHATNIGEDVIFIAYGKDIRHPSAWEDKK